MQHGRGTGKAMGKAREEEELQGGFLCDPTTKSSLRVVAKPGDTWSVDLNFDEECIEVLLRTWAM